jgi:hypothetical protein
MSPTFHPSTKYKDHNKRKRGKGRGGKGRGEEGRQVSQIKPNTKANRDGDVF